MNRRLMMNLGLAASAVFALAVAAPAWAGCENCDKKGDAKAEKAEKKTDGKAAPAKQDGAKADKKAEATGATGTLLAAGCNCGAKEAKDCKCGGGCKCYEKKSDKPKADAAGSSGVLLAAACNCEKGGKNCTCPKGECKCPNCNEGKPKAKAA